MEIIDTFRKALKLQIHTTIFIFLSKNFRTLLAKPELPFYFAIQRLAHLSSSSTLTAFLPSSQQRRWQSGEGLCLPNFLRPWRRRGEPGTDSGQTHAQVLVYSPACPGPGRLRPRDAAPSARSRLFFSEPARRRELGYGQRRRDVLPLTPVTEPGKAACC